MHHSASLKIVMKSASDYVQKNRYISGFYKVGSLEILKRKLPPKRIEEFIEFEVGILVYFFKQLQKRKKLKMQKPEVLSGILRSFFLVCFHKEDLGEDVFKEVKDFYIEMISNGLTRAGKS